MTDVLGRLIGESARRVLGRRVAGPPNGGAGTPTAGGGVAALRGAAVVRPPARATHSRPPRWYPSSDNPDRRGLPLFEERAGSIFATRDNGHYAADLGEAAFMIVDGKVFPTPFNPHWRHGFPCYEIRGSQVFPTIDNTRDPFGVALFDIR